MFDELAAARLELTHATPAQLHRVVVVLEEASAWLRSRGIDQWPATFSSDWIGPPIERGETWLAAVDGTLAGTVTLAGHDPAWPDHPSASYVHRLAVRRTFAGLGRVLLEWARDEARSHGEAVLRLDCASANHRLRRYYEAAGFRQRGVATVHDVDVTLLERRTLPADEGGSDPPSG